MHNKLYIPETKKQKRIACFDLENLTFKFIEIPSDVKRVKSWFTFDNKIVIRTTRYFKSNKRLVNRFLIYIKKKNRWDVLKSDPGQPQFILNLAKAEIGLGDKNEAKKHLDKCLDLWKNADQEYIYYKEAIELRKSLE